MSQAVRSQQFLNMQAAYLTTFWMGVVGLLATLVGSGSAQGRHPVSQSSSTLELDHVTAALPRCDG
jgi:hypothetical protein